MAERFVRERLWRTVKKPKDGVPAGYGEGERKSGAQVIDIDAKKRADEKEERTHRTLLRFAEIKARMKAEGVPEHEIVERAQVELEAEISKGQAS